MFKPLFVILVAVSLLVTRLDSTGAQTTLFIEEEVNLGFQNFGPFDPSVINSPDFSSMLIGGLAPFAEDLTFNEVTGELTVSDGNAISGLGVNIDRASNFTGVQSVPDGTVVGGTFRGPATLGANQFPAGITIELSTFTLDSRTNSLSITDNATGTALFSRNTFESVFDAGPAPDIFASARYNRVRGSLFVQEVGGTLKEVLPSLDISEFEELNDLGISLDQFEINQRDGNLYDISSDSVDIYDPGNGSLLESIDISDFGIGNIVAHAIDSDRGNLLILEQNLDPGAGTFEDPAILSVNLFRIGGIAVPEPSQLVIVPFLLALSARRRRS